MLPGLAADAGKLVQNLSRLLYAARGRWHTCGSCDVRGNIGWQAHRDGSSLAGAGAGHRRVGTRRDGDQGDRRTTRTRRSRSRATPRAVPHPGHRIVAGTAGTRRSDHRISGGVTELGFAAHGRARHPGGFRGRRTARRGGRHPHRSTANKFWTTPSRCWAGSPPLTILLPNGRTQAPSVLARDHLSAALLHECGCRPTVIAYLIDSYCNGKGNNDRHPQRDPCRRTGSMDVRLCSGCGAGRLGLKSVTRRGP